MGNNNCFFDVSNTQLNASEQQTAKTSPFIEVLTLADDLLIKLHFINTSWLLPFNSCGSSKGVFWPSIC